MHSIPQILKMRSPSAFRLEFCCLQFNENQSIYFRKTLSNLVQMIWYIFWNERAVRGPVEARVSQSIQFLYRWIDRYVYLLS